VFCLRIDCFKILLKDDEVEEVSAIVLDVVQMKNSDFIGLMGTHLMLCIAFFSLTAFTNRYPI
jgi:hypothetical protein